MPDPCDECKGGTCEVKGLITDFITGKTVPDTDLERVRQRMARMLVEEKGYSKDDVEIGVAFQEKVGDVIIRPLVDLVVSVEGKKIMAIKCVYGAMEAGMRLVVSYGRLMDTYQIPYSVITNGDEARIMDTVTGDESGEMEAIPRRDEIDLNALEFIEYPPEKREKEKLILSAYEAMGADLCKAFEG